MSEHKVCIVGGTGFVGHHLAAKLHELNIQTKILSRRKKKRPQLLVLPCVEISETDVYDAVALEKEFQGCTTVINLVGILNERGHSGAGFRKAHVDLTRLVVSACHNSGIKRLLHMSALHADASKGPSIYLRTKGEAEDYALTFARDLHVTSFRPSVIFGPGDSFFNRFGALLKVIPYAFPLACADARFAPVYVGDLADTFIESLNDTNTYQQRLNICGPETYSLAELVKYTAETLGLKRRIIPLPAIMSLMQAFFMDYFVPGKPFSLDNLDSLKVDSVCQTSGQTSEHHIKTSTGIKAIVPSYLANDNARNRYNQLRKVAHRDE